MVDVLPAVQPGSVDSGGALQRRFRLTAKRALFAEEYVVDWNGTQAAIRAGYSPRTAAVQASQLLTKANVLGAIQWAFAERIKRVQVNQDDIVRRLVNLAFTDISAFATWEGGRVKLKDLDDIHPDQHIALAEVQEDHLGHLRIKMADRMPALALLARHFGVIPTAGTREATAEHARATYERTVTERWDLNALSPEQLEHWDDIISTILRGEGTPDA